MCNSAPPTGVCTTHAQCARTLALIKRSFNRRDPKMSSPPKFKDLVEELFDVWSKWYRFGLQLDIPSSILADIDKSCRGDSFVAFNRVMQEWLNQQKEPSWAAIVVALRSRTVGEPRLADNLQDRHATGANAVVPRHHDRQLMLMPAASKRLAIEISATYLAYYISHRFLAC